MSKIEFSEALAPLLDPKVDLKAGVVLEHTGSEGLRVRYRVANVIDSRDPGDKDFGIIKATEGFWDPEHALTPKMLRADARELQILAVDEDSNQPLGRCSAIRVLRGEDVYDVPDWEPYYERVQAEREKALASGDSALLSRFEGTGVIVDPEYRERRVGFYAEAFLVRAIADKILQGAPFDSFTWSIHNPGYAQWLIGAGLKDSPSQHATYVDRLVQSVIRGDDEMVDPVLTPYLKALNAAFGSLEQSEEGVAQAGNGLVKIISYEGGCSGYEPSHERGVRVDGTGAVLAIKSALES